MAITVADWWPASLAHIAHERPWEHDHVVVAEVLSFGADYRAGHRSVITVLIPMDDLPAVQQNLAGLNGQVSSSGPWPLPYEGLIYKPKFWVSSRDMPRDRYEPLILSWDSHNHTVFVPDPGFLMTYGLVPRATGDGDQAWDDLRKPARDIVLTSRPSVYDFPTHSGASVRIERRYLQDYLSLRNVALVQVFWEQREQLLDDDLAGRLGDKEAVEIVLPDKIFQINRHYSDAGVAVIQVWGASIVALPGPLPVSSNPLELTGLVWPGIEGPVPDDRAMSMSSIDFVYVSDEVLADFEGRPEFGIHPEFGSVTFGTQWRVTFCDRVGRNVIQLEIKKLYEGIPEHITAHWHKFAVSPPSEERLPALHHMPNIGTRARDLTYALVDLGEELANAAAVVGISGQTSKSMVKLDRKTLDYSGWWTRADAQPISHHVPLKLPRDRFLARSGELDKFVTERISEAILRKMLLAVGVARTEIDGFRTLKLLDRIVRLCRLAASTGINLTADATELVKRLAEEADGPPRPMSCLFALNDMRNLGAHTSFDAGKFQNALQRFGIDPGTVAVGYGCALDQVYDRLIAELRSLADAIRGAL